MLIDWRTNKNRPVIIYRHQSSYHLVFSLLWQKGQHHSQPQSVSSGFRGLGAGPPTSKCAKVALLPCLLQYVWPVHRVSKALYAGSYLSYNGEDSRTDTAFHEMKRSDVQTVSASSLQRSIDTRWNKESLIPLLSKMILIRSLCSFSDH